MRSVGISFSLALILLSASVANAQSAQDRAALERVAGIMRAFDDLDRALPAVGKDPAHARALVEGAFATPGFEPRQRAHLIRGFVFAALAQKQPPDALALEQTALLSWREALRLDPSFKDLDDARSDEVNAQYRFDSCMLVAILSEAFDSLGAQRDIADQPSAAADLFAAAVEAMDVMNAHPAAYTVVRARFAEINKARVALFPSPNAELLLGSALRASQAAGRAERALAYQARLDAIEAAKPAAQKTEEKSAAALLLATISLDAGKKQLDELFAQPGFQPTPDATWAKSFIYAIAADRSGNAALRAEAIAAWRDTTRVDPKLEVFQSGDLLMTPRLVADLYRSLAAAGYASIAAERWANAADELGVAVELADILATRPGFADLAEISNGSQAFATPLELVGAAGAASHHAQRAGEATRHFTRIADARLGGAAYEGTYQVLVANSFAAGDRAAFERYRALGKELYPASDYFAAEWRDHLLQMANSPEKLSRLEAELAQDGESYELQLTFASSALRVLHPGGGRMQATPEALALRDRMFAAYAKAAALRPHDPTPWQDAALHFTPDAYLGADADVQSEGLAGMFEYQERAYTAVLGIDGRTPEEEKSLLGIASELGSLADQLQALAQQSEAARALGADRVARAEVPRGCGALRRGQRGGASPFPHLAQMQTTPSARSGMRARASGASCAVKHQHSSRPAAAPHSFAPPHSGQRAGSSGASLTSGTTRQPRS
jgi:hypothetical protein